MDEFDPSLTKTELSGKDLIMDGELPMRNGRICEHDSPDDDDSYIGNKGKCAARTVHREKQQRKGVFTLTESECLSDIANKWACEL